MGVASKDGSDGSEGSEGKEGGKDRAPAEFLIIPQEPTKIPLPEITQIGRIHRPFDVLSI